MRRKKNIETNLSAEDQQLARDLAETEGVNRQILQYAIRLLPRNSIRARAAAKNITIANMRIYEQLVERCGQETADKWLAGVPTVN